MENVPNDAGGAPDIAALRSEVAALRAELVEALAGLAAEVRTRRLVVLDEQDREAIHTRITENYASLTVEFPYSDLEFRTCDVALTASGPGHSMGIVGDAGLYLSAGSEVVGRLEVQRSIPSYGDGSWVKAESALELFQQIDGDPTLAPQTRRQMLIRPTRIRKAGAHYGDARGVAKFAKVKVGVPA